MASPTAPSTERFSIIPSVLPSDFARLGEELQALEKAGADRIQWDVMDGVFVPNLTFGPDVIKSVRSWVDMPFEAHLMVIDPDPMLKTWVDAGCYQVIVHAETCRHLHRTLASIRDMGAKAAVALNPATPLEGVRHVLDLLDMLLVMTVNPGFGGQAYIATMEPKIAEAAAMLRNADHYIELEVDGGVGPETIEGAVKAGARALIAGSALYKDPEGLEHAVSDLRARARAACPGVE
jgi:ribulose-phosphate 3-epimerase